ncbi:MAG: ATP-NAD kinase family protein [Candidatus Bathyarchaeia archaeon]
MKKLGFIVNPIAGMGGSVGLKGTDGKTILQKAKELGAKPIAPARAELFLSYIKQFENDIQLISAAGLMGSYEAQKIGFKCKKIGEEKNETDADETKNAAEKMIDENVDLIVFCGGDGTARDIMDVAGIRLPILGVPTGVKMHSAVFAINPESASRITIRYLFEKIPLIEAEVMDVDEEAFRNGRVSAKLYGYVLTPYEPDLIQGIKVASLNSEDELRNQAAIAVYVIEKIMKPNIVYILGPGTTTRVIADLLNEKKTLLGVDLMCNKKIIAHDVNEKIILEQIKNKKSQIIVTPIGGQGFIFGRGNQQISPSVIRQIGKDNIIVIATKNKVANLRKLRIDTGDPLLDKNLRGNINVIIDYGEQTLMGIE